MSETSSRQDTPGFYLHIKNNRAGDPVFRVTPERYREACLRHPALAQKIEACIDWDLDRFSMSMRRADALVTWDLPTKGLAELAPRLKWIHVIGAGIEHLQPLDWLPEGVVLTNNKGVHAQKAEEYALMALLMLNARLPALSTRQRQHRYDSIYTSSIAGRRLLVIGAGNMGAAVGRAGKSLGLAVVGIKRAPASMKVMDPFDEIFGPGDLDRLLPAADIVAITVPLTPETRALIDAGRLDLMKPDAGLINMSRAQILDHDALVERLVSGHLSGAMLDVVDPEPLPAESPLWDAPNLIITPHVSSDDKDTYIPLTLDLVFENIARSLDGREFRNRVDPRRGY